MAMDNQTAELLQNVSSVQEITTHPRAQKQETLQPPASTAEAHTQPITQTVQSIQKMSKNKKKS